MQPSSYMDKIKIIENKLEINSPERVEEALQYYGNFYRNEEHRRDKIDARANLLIAAASIIIAVITGFLCMLIYHMEIISFSVLAAILIAYAIISTFIINSISASLEVNKLKNYSMTDKHYSDYGITESDLVYIRKVRAINYYILFNKNERIRWLF